MKKTISILLAATMLFSGAFGIETVAAEKSAAVSTAADTAKTTKTTKTKKAEKPGQVQIDTGYNATENAIKITWGKVENVSGYTVSIKSDGDWKVVEEVNNKTTSYRFGGLSPATTYKFKVQAFRKDNDTVVRGKASTVKKAATKPSQPVPTVTNVTENSITIEWSSVKCSGYELYQEIGGNSTLINTYKSNIRKVTMNCPNSGERYKFKVRSYKSDGAGKKNYSEYKTVEATTKESSKPKYTASTTPKYESAANYDEPTKYQESSNYQPSSTGTTYILNTNTKCYHKDPNCRAAKRINPENYSTSNTVPAGYSACGICAK